MSTFESFYFNQVDWSTAAGQIVDIRRRVFVVEQRFDKEVLSDSYDSQCYHILVKNDQAESIGCGRLNPDGRIGRIAVLIDQRGKGIGSMILDKLVEIAQQRQISALSLNVETELSRFYDQHKFHADGPVYMKQGIPYQRMTKRLV